MERRLFFKPENCSMSGLAESSPELAAQMLNGFQLKYDSDTSTLSMVSQKTDPEFYVISAKALYISNGVELESTKVCLSSVSFDNDIKSAVLSDTDATRVIGFSLAGRISAVHNGLPDDIHYKGRTYLLDVYNNYIYPTGTIGISELPAAIVGFHSLQQETGYTHVQILVSEIHENGVGGEGRHWISQFLPKDIDFKVTLEDVVPLCEGRETTNLNVMFYLLNQNDAGGMDVVDAYIVGGATEVTTFSVATESIPKISMLEKVYCLDPVLLTVNRHENSDIQFVRVEVGNYIADFEFNNGHNLLRIDISEYLQTLFANLDLFSIQSLETTIVVKMYDAVHTQLETHGFNALAVYGKNPENEIHDKLRVQWLDKFGMLHDVTFKVFQNVAEGESKQKYVSKGIEHEEKTGERSLSLAYVNANASQRIALESIVFADHVRAWIGDAWKRVKVANSYKNGTGREKRNFEITIKYAL